MNYSLVSPDNSMSDLSFSGRTSLTNTTPNGASQRVLAFSESPDDDGKIVIDHRRRRGTKRRLNEHQLLSMNSDGIDGIMTALSNFSGANNNDPNRNDRQRFRTTQPDLVSSLDESSRNEHMRLMREPREYSRIEPRVSSRVSEFPELPTLTTNMHFTSNPTFPSGRKL